MRLLHVREFTFSYFGAEPPAYAILSHKWDKTETDLSDVQSGRVNARTTTNKVSGFAQYVREHCSPIEWIWVDSCCLKQESAAELSEGVNCMFDWYRGASICVAYLRDVDHPSTDGAFRNSIWFKRGWTLQELLAPSVVVFVTSDWKVIGHKGDATHLRHKTEVGENLEARLAEVTRIPRGILQNFSLSHELSIEERFLWMDDRDTLKEEDQFYALFGIFGVAPGANYGEKKRRARQRLIEAIEKEQGSVQHTQGEEDHKSTVEFRKWLSAPDLSSNHDTACDRREPGTCEWLLHHETYTKWKSGQLQHLWVNGKPGCGKSVLCSAVIQDLEVHQLDKPNTWLGYFYFTHTDQHKQNYSDLVLSLVSQLASSKLVQFFLKDLRNKPGQVKPSMLELEKILVLTIETFDEVFVVLDALDESPETGGRRRELVRRLDNLVSGSPKLKLFATSRKLPDISDLMEDLPGGRISIGSEDVIDDIQKYVAAQLDTEPRLKKFKPQIKIKVKENIFRRVDGMFRWAWLLLQKLSSLKGSRPSDIEAALATFPADLDNVYARIIEDLGYDDQRDALKLLKWITYSRRPLNLLELVDAVIIESEHDAVNFDDRYSEPEDILRPLASFVTTYEDSQWAGERFFELLPSSAYSVNADDRRSTTTKVRFAHFTVQEYLESTRILDAPTGQFYLESTAAHRYIAQSCLTYLMHYSKNAGKQLTEADLLSFPLLWYAATQWYQHAQLLPQDARENLEMGLFEDDGAIHDWLTVHKPDASLLFRPFQTRGYLFAPNIYYPSWLGFTKVTRSLLKNGSDTEGLGMFGNALTAASAKGHSDIVKVLLDGGANINALVMTTLGANCSALTVASDLGHIRVVKLLLEAGADTDLTGPRAGGYNRPIQSASRQGHVEVVKLLLKYGAKADQALTAAAGTTHQDRGLEIVKLLLTHGVETKDSKALDLAGTAGNFETMKLLLENGCKIDPDNRALDIAAGQGRLDVVKMLLQNGARVSSDAMVFAIENGHLDIVELLLNGWTNLNFETVDTSKLFYQAGRGGNYDVIELLLELGADVNATGRYEALFGAARFGHYHIVKRLLQAGVDVNIPAFEGYDALSQAVWSRNMGNVRLLLQHGADVETAVLHGALSLAAHDDATNVIQLFLEYGANVTTKAGDEALREAVKEGHPDVVALLLEKGANAMAIESGSLDRVFVGEDAAKIEREITKTLMAHGGPAMPYKLNQSCGSFGDRSPRNSSFEEDETETDNESGTSSNSSPTGSM